MTRSRTPFRDPTQFDAMGYYRTSRGGRAMSALTASLDDTKEMPS
jgi:hypothetical protein